MRGRRPLPGAIKLVRGSRRPLNREEPVSRLLKRMPPAPEFFDDECKRIYSVHGPRFIKAGLLSVLDLTMFETWVWWRSVRDLAARKAKETGLVVKAGGLGNPYLNPYLNAVSMATKALHQIEVEFGLSPASREKVKSLCPAQRSLFDDLLDDPEGGGLDDVGGADS